MNTLEQIIDTVNGLIAANGIPQNEFTVLPVNHAGRQGSEGFRSKPLSGFRIICANESYAEKIRGMFAGMGRDSEVSSLPHPSNPHISTANEIVNLVAHDEAKLIRALNNWVLPPEQRLELPEASQLRR